jgi:hypothetical protein
MRTTIKLLAVLALALTTFMQHSTASAATVFKFRGETASAFFSSTDGCIATDVFISATEGVSQNPPGKGDPISQAFIFISQYNFCTDTLLLNAEGFALLSNADFDVSGKLDLATLNTTINVFDFVSNTSFDIFIDLTWTGIGPLSRQSNNSHFNTPGCKIHSRFRGTFRSAEASGTVSDGTTNFTPEPSLGADLGLVKSGDVVIGCN